MAAKNFVATDEHSMASRHRESHPSAKMAGPATLYAHPDGTALATNEPVPTDEYVTAGKKKYLRFLMTNSGSEILGYFAVTRSRRSCPLRSYRTTVSKFPNHLRFDPPLLNGYQ
jgi:hypothetical protein